MRERRRRVLIIENDPDMLFLLERAFAAAGYLTECYEDGNRIVELKHQHPDLVVLDKELAAIDGVAITKFLRLRKEYRDVPIIMISAYAVRKKALEAGVNIFISKPFRLSHLVEIADSHIYRLQRVDREVHSFFN